MISRETLDLLNAYVDSELDEATRRKVRELIDSSSEVRQAHDDLRQLKRLVQCKAPGLVMPGGLGGRIFRDTRKLASSGQAPASSRRVVHRRVLVSLAATLALALGIWAAFFAVRYPGVPTPVAHAGVVNQVATQFTKIGEPPPPLSGYDLSDLGACEKSILREIATRFDVTLRGLPRFEDAMFVSFSGAEICGVDCVRLDYRDLTVKNPRSPAAVISVFAVSRGKLPGTVEEAGDVLHCQCPKVPGPNVFCFRDEVTDFRVATWKSPEEFEPRICLERVEVKECSAHGKHHAEAASAEGAR